jgi:hypothetical protein
MCARVGNQQSRGVVTARFEPTLFGAIIINVEISNNRLTPYLSEDLDSSYYQVVSDFGFPVRYTCVSFSLFPIFIPRSTEKAKKNSYLPAVL